MHLLRGNSHDPAMAARARSLLAGRPVDLLFLDGDHRYDGVAQDHATYSPLVRDGGLVALHDIQPGDDASIEVPRFWQALRDAVGGFVLIADRDQKGYGMCVPPASTARYRRSMR